MWLPVNDKSLSIWQEWGVVALLLGFLLVSEYVGWFDGARAIGEKVTTPVTVAGTHVLRTIVSPINVWRASSVNGEYVRDLENQYAQALAKLSELDQLEEENLVLRNLLDNSVEIDGNRIIAAPLSSLAAPMVAAGRENGVESGTIVTVERTLVGIVRDVSARQSRIDLLTQTLDRPILVRTESGAQGLVTGDGRRILLTEIPRQAELKIGERVVTVGQEGIGRNILVGTVGLISTRHSAPTQTAFIDQHVSFYETPVVEIW
jgi:cell shape-determining protein MreC